MDHSPYQNNHEQEVPPRVQTTPHESKSEMSNQILSQSSQQNNASNYLNAQNSQSGKLPLVGQQQPHVFHPPPPQMPNPLSLPSLNTSWPQNQQPNQPNLQNQQLSASGPSEQRFLLNPNMQQYHHPMQQQRQLPIAPLNNSVVFSRQELSSTPESQSQLTQQQIQQMQLNKNQSDVLTQFLEAARMQNERMEQAVSAVNNEPVLVIPALPAGIPLDRNYFLPNLGAPSSQQKISQGAENNNYPRIFFQGSVVVVTFQVRQADTLLTHPGDLPPSLHSTHSACLHFLSENATKSLTSSERSNRAKVLGERGRFSRGNFEVEKPQTRNYEANAPTVATDQQTPTVPVNAPMMQQSSAEQQLNNPLQHPVQTEMSVDTPQHTSVFSGGQVASVLEPLPKPTPNSDPLHCFVCKNEGDFINCGTCTKPYHLFCADLERMPQTAWECKECQIIARDRLIRELKEKSRLKVLEREHKKIQEMLLKAESRRRKEDEFRRKREEKEAHKVQLRLQRQEAQQARNEERKQLAIQQAILREEAKNYQIIIGPDGQPMKVPRQATLQLEKSRKKQKFEITEAEREKIERNRVVKSQFMTFSGQYPEYVDRNQVRYPIPDNLLQELPELHQFSLVEKPKPLNVTIPAAEFEQLIYIWEFCNNFAEFLQIDEFKLEELRVALTYQPSEDARMQMSTLEMAEQLDWTQQMEVRHIREKGLHLFNCMGSLMNEAFLQDLFPEDDNGKPGKASAVQCNNEESQPQVQILSALNNTVEDKKQFWPEIARLILVFAKSEDATCFGPHDDQISAICKKLVNLRPHQFVEKFSVQEKISLFSALIDLLHETESFRASLNQRFEERAGYHKEKMDIYQQIRDLEATLKETQEKKAVDENEEKREEIEKEIVSVRNQIAFTTSRTEVKLLKERLANLQDSFGQYDRQISTLEEQIKKKQATIGRLNDKSAKTSFKTNILGTDAEKREYWHFIEDLTRIYVRQESSTALNSQNQKQNEEMTKEQASENVEEKQEIEKVSTWHYYETEDQFVGLLESLNLKGVRERRLQESLRKIRDRLKLKKSKISKKIPEEETKAVEKPSENNDTKEVEQNGEGSLQKQENTEMSEKPKEETVDAAKTETEMEEESAPNEESIVKDERRRVMFETDDYEKAISQALWFGQKVPQKRRFGPRGGHSAKDAVETFFENSATMKHLHSALTQIEHKYTESSDPHDREWATQEERDKWLQKLTEASCVSELVSLVQELDQGMSLPLSRMTRKVEGGPAKVQRFRLQLFKFWPSQEMRQAWQAYSEHADSLSSDNLNAALILSTILRSVCEQFVVRQADKMVQKNKNAIQNAMREAQNHENLVISGSRRNNAKQQIVSNDQFSKRNAAMETHYSKYFESSESESEQDSQSEEVEETDQQQSIYEKPAPQKKQKGRKQGRVSDSEIEENGSSAEVSEVEESEEEPTPIVKTKAKAKSKAVNSGKSTGTLKQTKLNLAVKPKSSLPKRNGRGKKADVEMKEQTVSESESESEEEEEGVQSQGENSDEEDSDREWEEYCYVCQDGGNVMCCDGCSQVAHFDCLELKKPPKRDWFCKDCEKSRQAQVSSKQPKKNAKKAIPSTVEQSKKTRHSKRAGAGNRRA